MDLAFMEGWVNHAHQHDLLPQHVKTQLLDCYYSHDDSRWKQSGLHSSSIFVTTVIVVKLLCILYPINVRYLSGSVSLVVFVVDFGFRFVAWVVVQSNSLRGTFITVSFYQSVGSLMRSDFSLHWTLPFDWLLRNVLFYLFKTGLWFLRSTQT